MSKGDMPAFFRRKLCRGRPGEAGVARLLPEALPISWGRGFGGALFPAHPAEYRVVAVISIVQRPVHAADGGGGGACLFGDFQISAVVLEHGGHLEPLGDGDQLIDRTQILEEAVAFFPALQTEDGIEQEIHCIAFYFFVHVKYLLIAL